jgi:cell wall-associated NlpC family hydrolase
MAARSRRLLGVALGLALVLAGCGGAPPKPRETAALFPAVSRGPQEEALKVALSDFYGAPYHRGGTTPAGVDCSGLIQALYHRAGINLPRTVAQQYKVGQPVGRQELRFGDVVFFNRYCQNRSPDVFLASIISPGYGDQVCHNGIYLGNGRFVHASPRGVFVSRLDAKAWRISYRGARRYLPGDNY